MEASHATMCEVNFTMNRRAGTRSGTSQRSRATYTVLDRYEPGHSFSDRCAERQL